MQRNEEQNGRVQLKLIDRTQPIEWTAEITLPDYRGEISRLLWVRPTLLPSARFVGGGKIDFSGPVCYHILYTGPDGAMYGADHEGSYAFSVPRENAEGFDSAEGPETVVELYPDAVISRVIGPRKLSVRCRMRARVRGYATKNITPRFRGEGAAADRIHRLCDATETARMAMGEVESFQISDDVELERREDGEPRLISSRGELFIPEVTVLDGTVHCRGEALMTLLCCREGTGEEQPMPFVISRRIPFEKDIPFADISPDWHACVAGEIGEISAVIEGDSVALTVGISLVAQGQCEESILLYKDAFLPGSRVECHHTEENLRCAGFCGNRNFSVSGERPFSEIGIPADAVVLDAVADAEVRELQSENGRTALQGEMRCHVLYHRGDEYATGEFSIPFRGILEESADDMHLSCSVPSCRVTPSGEQLRVDAEIALAMQAYCNRPVRCLSEAIFTPAEDAKRADLEICYPAPGDSLWTVGKRYGISPDAIAAANGLASEAPGDGEVLEGINYLLIPQK